MDKAVSEIFKDAVLKSLSQYSKNGESLQVCCAEIPVKVYCDSFGVVLELPNTERFLLLFDSREPLGFRPKDNIVLCLRNSAYKTFRRYYDGFGQYCMLLTGKKPPEFLPWKNLDEDADQTILDLYRAQSAGILDNFAVLDSLANYPNISRLLDERISNMDLILEE